LSEAQFLEQVRANQGIIYKLVGLYASDGEEKKDLYQEVLLQAWKGWPAFRGEAKFSTWLYRICLNTILTQKRKHHPVEYTDSLETNSPSVQHSSIQQEQSFSLQKAIRQLPETDRAIVSLHLDGYENAEIAEVLGITANHVAVKWHRCKQQLANLLKNKDEY
jgi:RNA polymerase sigma-70 factor (ECF subfamily)